MSDPITAACHADHHAAHDDGPRPMPPTLIVLHSTEGGTAAGIAHLFTSKNSGGSAQLVVDDDACYRCLPDDHRAWGAPGANLQGLHIEMCAYAKWPSEIWHTHEPMLHRAAYKVAAWCKAYKIPVTLLDPAELRAGKHGITTHRNVSDAWHLTDHWDPGPGFPIAYFLGLVNQYLSSKPPPSPKPVVKHFSVFVPGQEPRGLWNRAELDDFAGRVIANNQDPKGPIVSYEVKFDPSDSPVEP